MIFFITIAVALAAASENEQETRVAVIDNFLANSSIETAVDLIQLAGLHFAGFYNITLLAATVINNAFVLGVKSVDIEWREFLLLDGFYLWFKVVQPG